MFLSSICGTQKFSADEKPLLVTQNAAISLSFLLPSAEVSNNIQIGAKQDAAIFLEPKSEQSVFVPNRPFLSVIQN